MTTTENSFYLRLTALSLMTTLLWETRRYSTGCITLLK